MKRPDLETIDDLAWRVCADEAAARLEAAADQRADGRRLLTIGFILGVLAATLFWGAL